ncbi:MAG: hypothetical protein MZV63_33600 [Marinilabiliales bacterium]|nr:hypothetical protein [Marinilabiliales bacterium]
MTPHQGQGRIARHHHWRKAKLYNFAREVDPRPRPSRAKAVEQEIWRLENAVEQVPAPS